MQSGKVVKSFTAKNGCKVVLRTPRWDDLDDFLELINSLVEERADVLRSEKVSRDEEMEWLSRLLVRLEKDEVFYLVAEVEKKVVAVSEVSRRSDYEKHVGVIGIAVKSSFRDLGIGTEMIKILEERAHEIGLKVLTLSAYASNERAIHVYAKNGFVQTGFIPKKFFKEGKYVDEVIMTKLLE